jgi:hypothetical protein
VCLYNPCKFEGKTVTAGKNAVNEPPNGNGGKWGKTTENGGNWSGKEKTGLVSQGMAEEAGEFRMSTT